MTMGKLIDSQKPVKFLINTLIMQRKGANVVMVHNNFYDSVFDQYAIVTWPKEKAGKMEQSKDTIQCMVSVYALSALNGLTYSRSEI
jgi:hypothetical protein